jgi:hypothetical protein
MDGIRFDAIARTLAGRAPRGARFRTFSTGSPAAAEATPSPATNACSVPFEAAVRRGPSLGLALVGVLGFDVDDAGGLTGILVQADATTVPVVGQATGRAIALIFTLGEGRVLFGVGTAATDVRSCPTILGGPLVGPAPGDTGDWGSFIGSRPLRSPTQEEINTCNACIQDAAIAYDTSVATDYDRLLKACRAASLC